MRTEPANNHSSRRLHVLDAFRAIAIGAVILCHYFASWGPPQYAGNLYGYKHTYPVWLGWGALGVQFFFIISGFVIFMTLERCASVFEFWVRRFARLYPEYVVALVFTFCVMRAVGPMEFGSTGRDLLIGLSLATPFVRGARFVDQVYWSLVVEVQFYIVIGLIYLMAGKRFAAAWALYAGLTLVCSLCGAMLGLHALVTLANRFLLLPFLPHFTLGIAFYLRYAGRITSWRVLLGVALVTYVVVAWRAPLASHIVHAMMLLLFALFVTGHIAWLAIRPLRFVGEVSYPLYLIHANVGIVLIHCLTRYVGMPDLAAAFVATAACIILAYALTIAVEAPSKRAILDRARPYLERLVRQYPKLAFPAHIGAGT